MAYPTIFANLAAGNQPLALFDSMFAIVAQISSIPSVASGQNTVALTPIGNAPTLAAYTTYNAFRFKAVATSSAPVSASFASLATLPVYKRDGTTQVAANDVISGNLYMIIYDPTLNSGGGGFYLEVATVPVVTNTAGSGFSTLKITNNPVTPNTQIDVTAQELTLVNPSTGGVVQGFTVTATINALVSGVVNGLDTGTFAANTWYAVWGISNGTTIGALLSTSFTAPTLPAGYTYRKRLGSVRTDATNAQTSTVTITIAVPGVVSWTAHGLPIGTPVVFSTTGALPTGITAGTTYYVAPTGYAANTFQLSTTYFGTSLTTSGSQSGTHTATVPAVRLLRTIQVGNQAQYQIVQTSSTPVPPVIANGTAGTYSATSPVLASASVVNFVPPTASKITVNAAPAWRNGTGANLIVAPSTNWGGTNGGSNGTMGQVYPLVNQAIGVLTSCTMVLESLAIAWASDQVGGAIACMGWEDNL